MSEKTVMLIRSLEDSLAHWGATKSRDGFDSVERTWHQ